MFRDGMTLPNGPVLPVVAPSEAKSMGSSTRTQKSNGKSNRSGPVDEKLALVSLAALSVQSDKDDPSPCKTKLFIGVAVTLGLMEVSMFGARIGASDDNLVLFAFIFLLINHLFYWYLMEWHINTRSHATPLHAGYQRTKMSFLTTIAAFGNGAMLWIAMHSLGQCSVSIAQICIVDLVMRFAMVLKLFSSARFLLLDFHVGHFGKQTKRVLFAVTFMAICDLIVEFSWVATGRSFFLRSLCYVQKLGKEGSVIFFLVGVSGFIAFSMELILKMFWVGHDAYFYVSEDPFLDVERTEAYKELETELKKRKNVAPAPKPVPATSAAVDHKQTSPHPKRLHHGNTNGFRPRASTNNLFPRKSDRSVWFALAAVAGGLMVSCGFVFHALPERKEASWVPVVPHIVIGLTLVFWGQFRGIEAPREEAISFTTAVLTFYFVASLGSHSIFIYAAKSDLYRIEAALELVNTILIYIIYHKTRFHGVRGVWFLVLGTTIAASWATNLVEETLHLEHAFHTCVYANDDILLTSNRLAAVESASILTFALYTEFCLLSAEIMFGAAH